MSRRAITIRLLAALLCVAAGARASWAQDEKSPTLLETVANVRWQSPVPSAQAMQGKGVMLIVYATWCPKCNEWSPELFEQIKQAAAESPAIVLAINADANSPSSRYALEKGLSGPNIVHGFDPQIDERLGFDSDLFRYAVFNPEGKLVEKGYAGSFFPMANGKEFGVARRIRSAEGLGEFQVLTTEMSREVKDALWPMEMGQAANDKTLVKMRASIPADKQGEFNTAIRGYLDKQLAICEQGVDGDVPSQIKSFQAADALAKSFATTPQGRKAKELVIKFDESPEFKKEMSAAIAYQKAVQQGAANPAGKKRELMRMAKRFEGTHYAKEAAAAAGN